MGSQPLEGLNREVMSSDIFLLKDFKKSADNLNTLKCRNLKFKAQ